MLLFIVESINVINKPILLLILCSIRILQSYEVSKPAIGAKKDSQNKLQRSLATKRTIKPLQYGTFAWYVTPFI